MAMNPQMLLQVLGPLLGMGSGALSSLGTAFAGWQANQDNQNRYHQGMQMFGKPDKFGQTQGMWGYVNPLMNSYGGAASMFGDGGALNPDTITGPWGSLNNRMASGAEALRDDSMAYLRGQGDQERRDINTQFNNLGSAIGADLTNRGLSASTIGAGMQTLNERGRADALGGLNERLNTQYLNTYAPLQQNYLNTLLGNWGRSTGAMDTGLGYQAMGAQLPMNLLTQQLNYILGVNSPYPDMAMNANINQGIGSGLGMMWGKTPDAPDQGGIFGF